MAFQAGPRALPLTLRYEKSLIPETDKVQTALILKLQFLIQCKAPLFPRLRPKPAFEEWGGGCFRTLGVPPPIALTLLGLQEEGGKGKGQNSPVNELVPPSPAWQMSKPWFCPCGHFNVFFQILPAGTSDSVWPTGSPGCPSGPSPWAYLLPFTSPCGLPLLWKDRPLGRTPIRRAVLIRLFAVST